MKVLIIEDEQELQREMESYFTEQGYLSEQAFDYLEAQDKVGLYSYDIIILDIGLPGGSGLDILKEIRDFKNTSVLILSARDSLDDKLSGLNLGADDYLTKPFHLAELHARMQALMRRRNSNGNKVLKCGDFEVDFNSKQLWLAGQQLELTPREYKLAEYLIINKNRVLSKQNLTEHLWGDDYDMLDNYDFLYVHIKNLRKKMAAVGEHEYLKTIYGLGYKMMVE